MRARRRHPRGPRRDDGYVLIEVLVSMAVLAIGLVAVITSVLSALNVQKDASTRLRAGLILQEKLDEVATMPYVGEPLQGVGPDGRFRWTVRSSPWRDRPRDGFAPSGEDGTAASIWDDLFEVTVEVSWDTAAGPRRMTATELVKRDATFIEEPPPEVTP